MIDFRKKALILTLAATVSVTGSFAADNYKNCLMDMKFESTGNNEVSLVLDTKTPYEGNISPMRKDAGTFVIMLPETDSQAPTPDLSKAGNCIQSVDIRKMPYVNGSKGYTRIMIKTAGIINLNASTALYIPTEENRVIHDRIQRQDDLEREARETREVAPEPGQRQTPAKKRSGRRYTAQEQDQEFNTDNTPAEPIVPEETSDQIAGNDQDMEASPVNTYTSTESGQQKYLLGLMVVLIILTSIYAYLKAQDKLTNVQGEKLKIDIDDKDTETKKEKHKISRTINKLDNAYAKTSSYKMKPFIEPNNNQNKEPEEKFNIVDLDALFKEKKSQTANDDNEAKTISSLDDFLNGFTFDDSELIENIENLDSKKQAGFDEEVFEKILKNTSLSFTKDDIACFNELLQSEISDNVIKNIENYAVSNPITSQKDSKDKLLENILTDYAISRNITFSSADTEIIKKLLSVEIDEDFVKDLRTDPSLTKKMIEEMKAFDAERSKPSEIVTLNVKDMLPDLSAALRKQGNKPILSEAKPETVYFSEGYEVNTLSVDIDLPDLSKEIKNKKAYEPKPSYNSETVDLSFADAVDKLHTSGLPDLKDVAAHPKKYADKKQKQQPANEKELLNNILNVQFKPFDDGTHNFEIINNIDNEEEETSAAEVDIEKEFSQFENFEVAKVEEPEKVYNVPDYDDFEALFDQNYVDLDANKDIKSSGNSSIADSTTDKPIQKQEKQNKINPGDKKEEFIPQDLQRAKHHITERKERPNSLISMLKKFNIGQKEENKRSKDVEKKETPASETRGNNKQPLVKCILDGINYDIVSTATIGDSIGCHLGKSENGYVVLAYEGEKLSIIKEYDSLKTEKLQARLSETLGDGTPRYIIKIGLNKFIVDIRDNQVRYVMDL